MASLISGFEYDIFISYRQKDNKGERWVSEFVDALVSELDATFKEDVTIYFDENPHDGLLETHDVDASLKDKLRCLIFIPIISRTYCDPKSFAWEHEFKAFVDQASGDKFGLRIKLSGGNVACRVLPVRIHDLNIKDTSLCEQLIGGSLRGVDFIYIAPGVNRPLRIREDNPQDNQNKTYYRDQINKVANAVEEIISTLEGIESGSGTSEELPAKTGKRSKESGISQRIDRLLFSRKVRKGIIALILISISLFLGITLYEMADLAFSDKSVAPIPLPEKDLDPAMKDYADLFYDAVWEKLSNVNKIVLLPKTSCLRYRNSEKNLRVIGRELKANYLLTGEVVREGNSIGIWMELTKRKANKQQWYDKYKSDEVGIMELCNDIVLNVASKLRIRLSPEEVSGIQGNPTSNDDAYRDYAIGSRMSYDAQLLLNIGNKLMDSTSFRAAIALFDRAIEKDPQFAAAYARRAIARSFGFYRKQLDSTHIESCMQDIEKALKIDSDLAEIQNALGFYYYYCKEDNGNALEHFNIAAQQEPDDYQPLFYMAMVYRKEGDWKKSQELICKVVQYEPDAALVLTNIGLSYTYLHKYDSALIYHQKAIEAMPAWLSPYINKIETEILKNGNTDEARVTLQAAKKNTGNELNEQELLLRIYEGNYYGALQLAKEMTDQDFKIYGSRYVYLARISGYLNMPDDEQQYYDSAQVMLENKFRENTDDADIKSYIGLAAAGKGIKETAITAGKNAVELEADNKLQESDMKIKLAEICVMSGSYDEALGLIEDLLNNPSCLSSGLLRLDPVWKPLRGMPEFLSILKRYNTE